MPFLAIDFRLFHFLQVLFIINGVFSADYLNKLHCLEYDMFTSYKNMEIIYHGNVKTAYQKYFCLPRENNYTIFITVCVIFKQKNIETAFKKNDSLSVINVAEKRRRQNVSLKIILMEQW